MKKLLISPLLFLVSIIAFAQTSDFSGTSVNGCSPLVVQFTDLSTGPVTTWFWDFGNGNTSTLQNPAAVYVTPGTYTVSLTVTNGGTGSNTKTKINYITVFNAPTSNFSTPNPTNECAPLNISFNDNSIPGDGTISQWSWDFGDGNTSNLQNPSNNYTSDGNYNVTLVVTDDNGCSNTTVMNDFVTASALPTISFSANPQTGCIVPTTTNFTNASTGASPLSYFWDFGDGNTSNLENPSNTYISQGSYTVKLKTTTGNGCIDSLSVPSFIVFDDLSPDFSANDSNVCLGESVTFNNLSSASATNWLWDFGDGNTSTLQNPAHNYTSSGIYSIKLIASNGSCLDSITKTNFITVNSVPSSSFSGDNLSTCIGAPFMINFTDASTGASSWSWDFGDGNTSNLQNPSNTYNTLGTYTVRLITTNTFGCSDTLIKTDSVQVGLQPTASFAAPATPICAINNVLLTDASTNALEWLWTFGNGDSSSNQNPTYQYSDTGTYDISLTAINNGCSHVFSITNAVTVQPSIAAFNLNPSTGCAIPHTVFFTDQSTLPDTWFWDFGDLNTSTLQNPVHNYTSTGKFTVSLTVTDTITGCSNVITDTVNVSAPSADFTGAPLFGCGPLTVNFTDASPTAIAWSWNFGDGDTSTLQNPTHTYSTPGVYTVILTITDANGCMNVRTRTNYVQVIGPNVNFGADTLTNICAPLTVNFTDSTIFGAPITNWAWDFGDGNTSNLQNPTNIYTSINTFDISLTVTDIDGCSRTFSRNNYITIIDTTAPSITCPANQTIIADNSCNGVLADYTVSVITNDNCDPSPILIQNPTAGTTVFDTDTTVWIFSTDASGNTDSCSFLVTLSDTLSPSITCPGNQIIYSSTSCNGLLADYTSLIVSSDNCDPAPTLTQSPAPGITVFDTDTTVWIFSTDASGNTDSCSFEAIVLDTISPVISCPSNQSGVANVSCNYTLLDYTSLVTTSDNCASTVAITQSPTAGTIVSVGTTTITLTANDGNGNTNTCTFDVIVEDNTSPSITCPGNQNIFFNSNCQLNFPDYTTLAISADNCGSVNITQNIDVSNSPIVVTLTADDGNGNTNTCAFNVTSIDNISPTITCPDNQTVNGDSNCNSVLLDYTSIATVADNCTSNPVVTQSPVAGTSISGTTTVTLTVTDNNNNSSSCSFEVTVVDATAPIVECLPEQKVELDINCEFLLPDYTAITSSSDNCDPNLFVTQTPEAGIVFSGVQNVPVILTFEDASENSTVCSFNVAIENNLSKVNCAEEVSIASLFTPNGDGKNDAWVINTEFFNGCSISVSNRWGQEVFESNNYNNDWDGDNLPDGVYYYTIICPDGKNYSGPITILRTNN